MTDGVTHDLIYGLYVHATGDEAIHLRSFSSDNTVSHNVVRDTGLLAQFFGEGIYVGTAHKNWCKYSGCQPDREQLQHDHRQQHRRHDRREHRHQGRHHRRYDLR